MAWLLDWEEDAEVELLADTETLTEPDPLGNVLVVVPDLCSDVVFPFEDVLELEDEVEVEMVTLPFPLDVVDELWVCCASA